jgi:hypothetical protein
MKFHIRRTSMWNKTKPCKEAYQIDGFRVDERTVKDPSKIPDGEKWYKEGVNHRLVKGHICRDFPTKLWVMEINSLEELMKFSKKYGELVIRDDDWAAKDMPMIEIYDDYRE